MCSDDEPVLPIALEIPEPLNLEVRRLAQAKYLMDLNVYQHAAGMLAGSLHDGGYGPAEPLPFLARVLPFMCAAKRGEGGDYVLVPTANTLGCSWRWRRRMLDDKKAQRLVQQLTDARALEKDSLSRASYALIRPLGIFAPHEGKNRVDFLREEGIEQIPAEVFYIDYPSANRLKLYRVEAGTFVETWAVLDDRWVERVAHPSWSLPVLTAYGVAFEPEWPGSFAPINDVLDVYLGRRGSSQALGNSDFGNAAVVDLVTLKGRSKYQTERVSYQVAEMQLKKGSPRFWLSTGACLVICGTVMMVLPAGRAEVSLLAGIAIGAAIGGLAAVASIQRRIVRKYAALPRRLVLKRQRPPMMDTPAE